MQAKQAANAACGEGLFKQCTSAGRCGLNSSLDFEHGAVYRVPEWHMISPTQKPEAKALR